MELQLHATVPSWVSEVAMTHFSYPDDGDTATQQEAVVRIG